MLKTIIKIKHLIKIGIVGLFLIALPLTIISFLLMVHNINELKTEVKTVEEVETIERIDITKNLIEQSIIIGCLEKQMEIDKNKEYEIVLSASNDYLPPEPK